MKEGRESSSLKPKSTLSWRRSFVICRSSTAKVEGGGGKRGLVASTVFVLGILPPNNWGIILLPSEPTPSAAPFV